MEESTPTTSSSQSRRFLLPPPHRPWLRIFVLAAIVLAVAAVVWFGVVQLRTQTAETQEAPTLEDIEQRSAKMIVRLDREGSILTAAVEPDGSGILFIQNAQTGREETQQLNLDNAVVKQTAGFWVVNGFYALPNSTERGTTEAMLAVGPFVRTVACTDACPPELQRMVTLLLEELPASAQSFIE